MTSLPITLIGGTGLTGSATLLALLQSPSAVHLTAITRKDTSSPVQSFANASTSFTNRALPNLADAIGSSEGVGPNGGVYISCLGTTRGQAGGFEKQKEIDLYLNRDLVTKAKADGAKTAILVSSGGANPNSMMGYPQIKGELEEDFKKLDFDHCVILRPGLLMGARDDFRGPEWITQKVFGGLKSIGLPMKHLMTDGADVGRCIAYLAVNPPTDKVVTLGNAQILEMAQKYKESEGKA